MKKISCKRCRFRKLRCSRTEPCQSCSSANQPCEYRDSDCKTRPVSTEYTASLESRVAWLESFILSLADASPEDRESRLKSFRATARPHNEANQLATLLPLKYCQGSLQPGPGGSLIYHGPTSIHRTWSTQPTAGLSLNIPPDSAQHPISISLSASLLATSYESITEIAGFNLEDEDEAITNGLLLFFQWQYSHFMFIYREAFLRDHFSDRQNCKYWSPGLLLSMCALGLQMSSDTRERDLGDKFYTAAESVCILSGLTQPSIITVQTILCLAFYALGQGDLSKSWGLSGIAFRMAQDLGFQKDPADWILQDFSIATNEDIEIRRRIYWGCYNSDKLISLILGRPVQLPWHDASVAQTDVLPDFPQMHAWLPAGFSNDASASGKSSSLILCFREQIRLSRSIERLLSGLAFLRAAPDEVAWEGCVGDMTVELYKWQDSLPLAARWNKWEPCSAVLLPSVAVLHLLFYSTLIALNFDQAEADPSTKPQESSRDICVASAEAITCLVRKYRQQHGLRFAPIILIYSISQAARTLRSFGAYQDETAYLYSVLEECSSTWELAGEALGYIHQGQNVV